jgi:hypothetical protein
VTTGGLSLAASQFAGRVSDHLGRFRRHAEIFGRRSRGRLGRPLGLPCETKGFFGGTPFLELDLDLTLDGVALPVRSGFELKARTTRSELPRGCLMRMLVGSHFRIPALKLPLLSLLVPGQGRRTTRGTFSASGISRAFLIDVRGGRSGAHIANYFRIRLRRWARSAELPHVRLSLGP